MAGIKKGTVLGKWSDERKKAWREKRWPVKASNPLASEASGIEEVKEMLVEKPEEVK